jgi:hypothetical protein
MGMLYAFKGAHTLFTGQRETERETEREREIHESRMTDHRQGIVLFLVNVTD